MRLACGAGPVRSGEGRRFVAGQTGRWSARPRWVGGGDLALSFGCQQVREWISHEDGGSVIPKSQSITSNHHFRSGIFYRPQLFNTAIAGVLGDLHVPNRLLKPVNYRVFLVEPDGGSRSVRTMRRLYHKRRALRAWRLPLLDECPRSTLEPARGLPDSTRFTGTHPENIT